MYVSVMRNGLRFMYGNLDILTPLLARRPVIYQYVLERKKRTNDRKRNGMAVKIAPRSFRNPIACVFRRFKTSVGHVLVARQRLRYSIVALGREPWFRTIYSVQPQRFNESAPKPVWLYVHLSGFSCHLCSRAKNVLKKPKKTVNINNQTTPAVGDGHDLFLSRHRMWT